MANKNCKGVKPKTMGKEELKAFLRSLAWCSWSSYHAAVAKEDLVELGLTEDEAKEEIEKFEGIIKSVAEPGSPK